MGRPRTHTLRRAADYPPPTPQPTPCRIWQGRLGGRGYGVRPDQHYIHVWVWEQINGPVPEGMYVCHRCDNPPCFRYDHLFLGTPEDNARDMVAKGRHRYVAHRGEDHYAAKLTADQVRAIRVDPRTTTAVAAEYGVSKSLVGQIRRFEKWKDIQ